MSELEVGLEKDVKKSSKAGKVVQEQKIVVMVNNRVSIIDVADLDVGVHFHKDNRPFTEEELAILWVK